jgi:hypothetical protein
LASRQVGAGYCLILSIHTFHSSKTGFCFGVWKRGHFLRSGDCHAGAYKLESSDSLVSRASHQLGTQKMGIRSRGTERLHGGCSVCVGLPPSDQMEPAAVHCGTLHQVQSFRSASASPTIIKRSTEGMLSPNTGRDHLEYHFESNGSWTGGWNDRAGGEMTRGHCSARAKVGRMTARERGSTWRATHTGMAWWLGGKWEVGRCRLIAGRHRIERSKWFW